MEAPPTPKSNLRDWGLVGVMVIPWIAATRVFGTDLGFVEWIRTVGPQSVAATQSLVRQISDPRYWSNARKAVSQAMDVVSEDPWTVTGTLSGLSLVALLVLWYRGRRRTHRIRPVAGRSNNTRGDEGMEILRTTRSSTFDFFGTHTKRRKLSRERSGSDMDVRRERMGSMDLFYSQRIMTEEEPPSRATRGRPGTPLTRERSRSTQASSQSELPSDSFSRELSRHLSEEEDRYLFDEFGLVTLSFRVAYYGPTLTRLEWSTWTPPTSWSEVSRHILPQDVLLKLQRTLSIDLAKGLVVIKEPKSSDQWVDVNLPAESVSVHIAPPPEGGVISLYVKGHSKDEWMEHTFESAQGAAQFQLDLLAYQVLGKTLYNMFEALSLAHLGSQGYGGQEFVLHDDKVVEVDKTEGDDGNETPIITQPTSCVAWDDAMRALSSIPTIRIALERLWLSQRRPVTPFVPNKKGDPTQEEKPAVVPDAGLLTEEYANKRLLLGPVDFFRLFVPSLPETALPQSDESNRTRMEQLLSWRKRASRASVLIRAYTMSHRVVNLGWRLGPSTDEADQELKVRIAFDDNEDNNRRDARAQNEMYEASVSRDVLCHVRPFDYFSQDATNRANDRRLVLSPYQAYSLVGGHVFKRSTLEDGNHGLCQSRDPVAAMPSLLKLISDHPDLEFFVAASFSGEEVAITCFVRSLPKGIDPQFDNVMARFSNSCKETRDKKVHVMIQIGQNLKISLLGMMLLRFLTFLFGLTKKGRESPLVLEARTDCTPLPGVRVASYAETHHFGGSMQTNPDLPKNYVAMTANYDAKQAPNMVSKLLFARLESQMSQHVVDFTYVLEGEQEDELPERALCTVRMVHVDYSVVAREEYQHVDRKPRPKVERKPSVVVEDLWAWTESMALYAMSGLAALSSRILKPSKDKAAPSTEEEFKSSETSAGNITGAAQSSDPREIAVDEMAALLKDVSVPMRVNPMDADARLTYTYTSGGVPYEIVSMPIQQRLTRGDMRRFLKDSKFNVEEAAVRIVNTWAWRGRTFPVDLRKCRIELQTGQFFQQGVDLDGYPVFYFQTMCRGLWRGDVDAVLSAAIHRFELSINEFCKSNSRAKYTLIILMGKPCTELKNKSRKGDASVAESSAMSSIHGDEVGDPPIVGQAHQIDGINPSNPRISPQETWQAHSNKETIERLVTTLLSHYPGRLSKLLLVKGIGTTPIYRASLSTNGALKQVAESPNNRNKVKFIHQLTKLLSFVDKSELATIVGGSAMVDVSAFDGF